MRIVTVDLSAHSVSVTPVIAKHGIGTQESFRCLLRRTRPAAAINGTFFDVRTLRPTGDIVIDRQLICRGDIGCAIAMTANCISFMPARRSDLYDRSNYDHVLGAGPTLIQNGKLVVVPRQEGFRSGVHFSRRMRAAVGLTKANKLLLVTTTRPEYLSRLARAMQSLGCLDAATMDGGSSVGLYCKGKLITNPGRGMTNCLLVYDNVSDYESRRASLIPAGRAGS
jgi:exopolysaccharide biosynthesis protein